MKPTSYLRRLKITRELEMVVIELRLQQWWYDPNTQRYMGTVEEFDPDDPKNPNCIGEWRDIEETE